MNPQGRECERVASGPSVLGLLFPALLLLSGPTPAARKSSIWLGVAPARSPGPHPGQGTIPAPQPPFLDGIPLLSVPDPLAEDPDDTLTIEASADGQSQVRHE